MKFRLRRPEGSLDITGSHLPLYKWKTEAPGWEGSVMVSHGQKALGWETGSWTWSCPLP